MLSPNYRADLTDVSWQDTCRIPGKELLWDGWEMEFAWAGLTCAGNHEQVKSWLSTSKLDSHDDIGVLLGPTCSYLMLAASCSDAGKMLFSPQHPLDDGEGQCWAGLHLHLSPKYLPLWVMVWGVLTMIDRLHLFSLLVSLSLCLK